MAKKYTINKNGYYKTSVWDGTYTESGRKRYVSIYSSKSSKDLEKKVLEFNEKVKNKGRTVTSDTSFLKYALFWEGEYKKDKSANTRAMYQNVINKHFSVIDCPISAIGRGDFVSMMNNIKGQRTKQQALMAFKQVIKSAIHDKYLPPAAYDDILDGYKLPRYKSKEKRPLFEHEKAALKKANLSLKDKAFVYILYGCGLRRGECAALTKNDIDFINNTIKVDKGVAYVGMDVIHKDTKNWKHREVPMPGYLKKVLEEYLEEVRTDELFAMNASKSLTKSSLDKMWRRILKAMQEVSSEPIEGLTPHIMRHNYCTQLCYKIPDVSINDIAYLMGDSKEVVLNVYNHLNMDKKKVSDTVNSALDL